VKWLDKALRLSAADRRLLIQSALLIAAIRIGLWLLPFRTLSRMLAKLTAAAPGSRRGDPVTFDRVAWSVSRASRWVPAATCLTQALAALALLRRHGVPARLHIGVAKDRHARLLAHAWVESNGNVVVGGLGLERYTVLLVLDGENS
jgi:Transglutaminase-like superfamily